MRCREGVETMYSLRPETIITYGVAETLYGLGYSYRDIGEKLNIPRNRVASLLHEGRGKVIERPSVDVSTVRGVSLPAVRCFRKEIHDPVISTIDPLSLRAVTLHG